MVRAVEVFGDLRHPRGNLRNPRFRAEEPALSASDDFDVPVPWQLDSLRLRAAPRIMPPAVSIMTRINPDLKGHP